MSGYLKVGDAIAEAADDLIGEVLEVTPSTFMFNTIRHRLTTQPERMAQIVMCLAIWSSAVPRDQRIAAAHKLAVQRCREYLEQNPNPEKE